MDSPLIAVAWLDRSAEYETRCADPDREAAFKQHGGNLALVASDHDVTPVYGLASHRPYGVLPSCNV